MVDEGIANELTTDGMTGKKAAEKFLKGDLEKHQDSYNGYGYGSSSLQNVTEKSKRKEIGNPLKSEKQRGLFGAELARRRAGKKPRMKITTEQLIENLEESKGLKLPKKVK